MCQPTGPNDPVMIPKGSTKTDWEVELAIVIGKKPNMSRWQCQRCVAGYCVMDDLSERAFQVERGGQWTKGKSCDGFTLGPWLVTTDAIRIFKTYLCGLK